MSNSVSMILGGAIGDGWGSHFEGSCLEADTVMPGECSITDDTQLTLATCKALVSSEGVDPSSIARSLLSQHLGEGIRGVGASTLKAMRDLEAGAHWALAGAKGERSAGNGAAIRIASLAYLLDPSDWDDRRSIRDVCRITHHNEEAYVGALAVVFAVRLVTESGRAALDSLVSCVASKLPDSSVKDRLTEYSQIKDDLPGVARRYGSSGWVVDSVPLALLACELGAQQDFSSVLFTVISCGGDTDSNASIAGQVLGAALGSEYIPATMVARLNEAQEIQRVAEDFEALVQSKT